MKIKNCNWGLFSLFVILISFFFTTEGYAKALPSTLCTEPDSTRYGIEGTSPLHLSDPSNITTEIQYDAKNNEYILIKRIGDLIVDEESYLLLNIKIMIWIR